MSLKHSDRKSRRIIEKRRDTRNRTQNEFVSSLEIVKDHKKIKNYRRRQGEYFDTEAENRYRRNYERIFGEFVPTKGGTYKWDPKKQALVQISDRIPSGKLVTL